MTSFPPGLTPSSPLHLWRCRLVVEALREAPTWAWSWCWEEGCGRRSCGQPPGGATSQYSPLSHSSCELWCSPAQPQALLILTPTHGPTSLTQGCAQCPGLGLSRWPWPLQSLGMKAGNGVLLPWATQDLTSPQYQTGKFDHYFYFISSS